MESKQFPMTRRDFLRFTAMAAGVTTLAACATPAPQAGQSEGAVAPARAPIVIRHVEAWSAARPAWRWPNLSWRRSQKRPRRRG